MRRHWWLGEGLAGTGLGVEGGYMGCQDWTPVRTALEGAGPGRVAACITLITWRPFISRDRPPPGGGGRRAGLLPPPRAASGGGRGRRPGRGNLISDGLAWRLWPRYANGLNGGVVSKGWVVIKGLALFVE